MNELMVTPVDYLIYAAKILVVTFAAFLMPLSAAFETCEDFNPRSYVILLIASCVGFAFIVFSIPLSHMDWIEGLAYVAWILSAGYGMPKFLVLLLVLLYPNCRAIASTDPLVDVDKLPPEAIQPIASEIAWFQSTPLFARRFHLAWIDFTIRIPRRRRFSEKELKAFYAQAIDRAKEGERALRHQAAELEAQQTRDLAQARSDFLASLSDAERGILATRLAARADARAQRADPHWK